MSGHDQPVIDITHFRWGTVLPPSWQQWDHHRWPEDIAFDLALLAPEHPGIVEAAATLLPPLRVAVDRYGAREGVERYLAASQTPAGLLDRRALVALLTYLSGFLRPSRLPYRPRHNDTARPRLLHPLEVALLRAAADQPLQAVLLRLLAAGATETEAAQLTADAITVHPDRLVTVQLPGSRGHHPRTVALTPGVSRDIDTLCRHSPDGYLLPLPRSDTAHHRYRAVDHVLRNRLHVVGLSTDPTVTATSIRITGLQAIHDTFGIAAAMTADGTSDHRPLTQQLHLAS